MNDATFISERDLNDKFQKRALDNEKLARQRFKRRPGRFQRMAEQRGALQAAIDLIGDGRTNSDGFIDLMMVGAPELTLEALYVEFAEQYGALHPHWFPEATVKVARAKLEGWAAK